MPNIQVKLRRGTTAQHAGFTGAEGEVTVDTDKDTVVVHDGSTAGGHELRKKSDTIAGSEIDNDAVDTAQIAANAVTSTEIAANAVTSAKLADTAVTAAKISDTDSKFNIDAITGNVGIGMAHTSFKLSIDGDLFIQDSGDDAPVAIFSGSNGSTIQLRDTSTTGSDNAKYNIESSNGRFEIGSLLDAGGTRTSLIRLHPKGTTNMGCVLQLAPIDVANLNAAETGFTAQAGMIAYVADGDGGSPCLAVHDGSSFKRVALGTAISTT